MHRTAVILLSLVLTVATAAPAASVDREDFSFRVGGLLGFRLFDSHQDLYNGSQDFLRDPADTPAHAPLGGLFFGVDYLQLTLEALVEVLPTSLDESDESALAFAGTLGVLWRLPVKLWKFTPYGKLEAGVLGLSADTAGTDLDLQAGLGAGVLFPIHKAWFGRIESVVQMTDGYEANFATNFSVRVGVGYAWGFNPDRDGDGILNKVDRCPDNPEDKDGFEDLDGCPDPDNDADGVPDTTDKCLGLDADARDLFAKTREDKDGFQDGDGCPDADNDADGLPDTGDKCPGLDADVADNFAKTKEDKDGFQDGDGCPDADNDADGVPDDTDKCRGVDADAADQFAKTREDKDGFQDTDGCPDADNDTDGIPDDTDKCRGVDSDVADNFAKTRETINGFEDDDGCPDSGKSKVQMEQAQIKILEKVFFENNEAVIMPVSFNLLNQVALTLKANPHLLLVEVQGHAGTDGEEDYNDKLSAKRANAVRQYLINRGVAPARLVAKWYGFSRPVKTCSTTLARRARHVCEELNRRVEFIILQRREPQP
ncbi:OmpA family protein [Myxococcota bacterium]|nr:OmpA family protein [Myxococcota bacterium]MBU1511076.1 OmpA family protein [Myxococcota bacterium]